MQGSRRCGGILVVDDDERMREYVQGLLEGAGYGVIAASGGGDAMAVADDVALVVLDVCMPVMSGYEVCYELKARRPELPVLFVSGERVESFDRVAGLLIGADDYLVKPFAPDELLARVRALLRRGQALATSPVLTKRELEVLICLADGLRQSDIAERLRISPKTVGAHVESIFLKLDVHTSAQAVAQGYRDRLLAEPPIR